MARPAPPEESLLAFVVAPIAGGMLFVALVGLMVFLNMARRKRSLHGTYNPQKQVSQTRVLLRLRHLITLFLMLTVLCVVPGACGAAAGAGLYAEAAGGGKTHLVTSAQ